MEKIGKAQFAEVFEVDDIVLSAAIPRRIDASDLQILAIEDEGFRYQPLRSDSTPWMAYAYLQVVVEGIADINPRSIQKSVNVVLKRAGYRRNSSTENYTYTFAKAFHDFHIQQQSKLFLLAGESLPSTETAPNDGLFVEGRRVAVMVERIERDAKARLKCIKRFGAICNVCGFDFEERYGALGKDFIHVHHHRVQLAGTVGEHEIDPLENLLPVCPKCHAMIHSRVEMLSVDELRRIWNDHNPKL